MRGFHVYTNVAHGEGFDLPMVQAMSMGKLVVSTDFLGHAEYMREDNSLPVEYSLTPVIDAKAPMYTSDQMWARPTMTSLMSRMQEAYALVKSENGKYYALKEAARQTMVDTFDEKVTTKRLITILEEIRASVEEPEPAAK